MKQVNIVVFAVICLLISSCSSNYVSNQESSNRISLGQNESLSLPPPSSISKIANHSFLVTLTKQEKTIPIQINTDQQTSYMLGFSSWGTRSLTLSYSNNKIFINDINALSNINTDYKKIFLALLMTQINDNEWFKYNPKINVLIKSHVKYIYKNKKLLLSISKSKETYHIKFNQSTELSDIVVNII